MSDRSLSVSSSFTLGRSGRKNMSTKAEIFSVGHLLADTTGLPGGGVVFLCILGKRLSSGVFALLVKSFDSKLLVISPLVLRASISLVTLSLYSSVGSEVSLR